MTEHVSGSNHFIFSGPHTQNKYKSVCKQTSTNVDRHTIKSTHKVHNQALMYMSMNITYICAHLHAQK